MYSIRKWLYKPKRDDTSILAQFFYADEDLNEVAAELDSFDGRKDPERCNQLVNQLRLCQDRVLNICNQIMDEVIGDQRANRDFRVKFPDDVLQENLAGQLWFGAECLAAGSSIMNREVESASMRPLAKALVKTLDNVRNLLREQCLKNPHSIPDKVKEALRLFDRLSAQFELSYVSLMVPIKTKKEYDMQQNVIVLFSETLQRALKIGLITQEMVDDYDPALMFTIPRLAIVCGLLICPDGPLNMDVDPLEMSELFRPFHNLLLKIRDLLWTLSKPELYTLEKALCSLEEPGTFQESGNTPINERYPVPDVDDYVQKVYSDYPSCKQFISDFYMYNFSQPSAEENMERPNELQMLIPDSESAEDLVNQTLEALQESLSQALNQVIDRSVTHDSGLYSDTCSNHSENHQTQSGSGANGHKNISEDTISEASSSDEYFPKDIVSEDVQTTQSIIETLVNDIIDTVVKLNDFQNIEQNEGPWNSSNNMKTDLFSSDSLQECTCAQIQGPKEESTSRLCSSDFTSDSTGKTLSDLPKFKGRISSKNDGECLSYSDHVGDQSHYCDAGSYSSSCSSCRTSSLEWDSASCSSDTSSYKSECQDDEEIALAIQAAEIATRNEARGRFRSSEDLIHRLFVCISGVADQLQTNFASDLRNILKSVFQIHCTDPSSISSSQIQDGSSDSVHSQMLSNMLLESNNFVSEENINVDSAEEANEGDPPHTPNVSEGLAEPPEWVPDKLAPLCMACLAPFTVVRRRHHCRNCGKVFCARCSANSVPLPHYGHMKPVRVCNKCFVYYVTPFLIENEA